MNEIHISIGRGEGHSEAVIRPTLEDDGQNRGVINEVEEMTEKC